MKLADLHNESPIAFGFHLAIVPEPCSGPDEVAAMFGLRPLGDRWREVDRTTADSLLLALLREDMAYSLPRLEGDLVRQAIDEFLNPFSSGTRFFTNGDWEKGYTPSKCGGGGSGPGWTPATQATFDGGIIAIDSDRSGILWLEDED